MWPALPAAAWVSGSWKRDQGSRRDCTELHSVTLGQQLLTLATATCRALLGAAGMPGKTQSSVTENLGPTSQPGSSAGPLCAEPCGGAGNGWGFLEEGQWHWHQGDLTAGTQQGLNKCLLDLFPCHVWRPVALRAVAAPSWPPPSGP